MLLIEADHVNKSFGSVPAVKDLTLHVSAGEIYGLVGPDGAGKTTSIRLLCGALTPTAVLGGRPVIRIGGYDMLSQTESARAQIGYLAQRFSLYEELTVLENIRFFAEVRGLPSTAWRPRCMAILDFVGLAGFIDRRAGQLSGGMRQKLGLAAALVHQPRILLLDEPTTGVDPVTRQDFWQLIIRLVGQKEAINQSTAVLVSTPYMDEAARCTRLGIMQRGQLVLEGTPGELCQRLTGQVLELAGEPLLLLRRLAVADAQVEDVQIFGDRLHLRVQPGAAEPVIARLSQSIVSAGARLDRLRPITPQMEDVFMHLLEAAR